MIATGSEISDGHLCRGENDALATGLPVNPRCRGRRVRQPVQRDIVQHVVSVEQALGLTVVVVKNPGREPHRRVRQGVADRLRPRTHDGAVGPVLLEERVERIERRAFLLGKSRRRWPAAGEHHRHIGRYCRRQVDVDAEQSWRRLARHRAGDGGAPVAALGDIAGVAEALHQLRPGAGDAVGIPAGAVGLPEKPKPGIDGITKSKASSARPP